jgi:hypothetical protein
MEDISKMEDILELSFVAIVEEQFLRTNVSRDSKLKML